MRSEVGDYLGPPELPLWVQASSATCILLGLPFFAINLAMMPGAYESAISSLRAPRWLLSAVDEWFEARNLTNSPAIAVHIRLTDQVGRGFLGLGFADRCVADSSKAADEVSLALSPWTALRTANVWPALLVASDDPESLCVRTIVERLSLPRVEFVSAPDGDPAQLPDGLRSQFIQETLARSVAFVGTNFSTFSSAIHQIRVLRNGYAINSSFLL